MATPWRIELDEDVLLWIHDVLFERLSDQGCNPVLVRFDLGDFGTLVVGFCLFSLHRLQKFLQGSRCCDCIVARGGVVLARRLHDDCDSVCPQFQPQSSDGLRIDLVDLGHDEVPPRLPLGERPQLLDDLRSEGFLLLILRFTSHDGHEGAIFARVLQCGGSIQFRVELGADGWEYRLLNPCCNGCLRPLAVVLQHFRLTVLEVWPPKGQSRLGALRVDGFW
mmetsp:Transcript_82954/g.173692  ORF Transcript_82954/g.173692 Transcript_82954/m.173692 type:complete len:222 (+) Transcript_82954:469-1134(+)